MTISIDWKLKKANPVLALGVVEALVTVEKHSEALWAEINSVVAGVPSRYTLEKLVYAPEVAAVRNTYKQIGKDPSRYRGSAEALLRRVLKGKDLYRVNNIVDLNNLVSLETAHPVGSYDLDKLTAPIEFRIGALGESYKGIGKETINIAELPVFADTVGPFGSPTSDSERAMITETTTTVMMVIISFTGRTGLDESVEKAAERLTQYCRGEIADITVIE